MTIIPRGKRLPWPRVLCTLLMLYPFAASSAADESAKVLIIPVDVCDDAQFGPDARKIAAVDPKTGERVTAKGVWWPREHIENMMAHFSKIGAKVVIWQTFEGGVTYPSKVSRRLLTDLAPGLFEAWKHYDPLRVAVEKAHKNSLLLIAEVRPFEFGVWFELPEGAPGAELYKMQYGWALGVNDSFARDDPEECLRMQHPAAVAECERALAATIRKIRLIKKDGNSTRVTPDRITLYVSEKNYFSYEKYDKPYDVKKGVEAWGKWGEDPTREIVSITISGLDIESKYKYIAIQTTFGINDSEPDFQLFSQTVEVYGDEPKPLLTAISSKSHFYAPYGSYGFHESGCQGSGVLDAPGIYNEFSVNKGFGKDVPGVAWIPKGICIRRGQRVFGKTPCLISSKLRAHYLEIVREILSYGVDGINLGYKNHGNLASRPETAFGFNPVVAAEFQKRYSVDIFEDPQVRDFGKYEKLQTEALAELVRAISIETRKAGKQVFCYINDPDAWKKVWNNVYYRSVMGYMKSVHWDWKTWAANKYVDAMIMDCDPMAPYHKVRWTPEKEVHIAHLKKQYPGMAIFMEYRMYGATKDAERDWAREYIHDAWRSPALDGVSCYEGYRVGYPPILRPGSRCADVTEAIVKGIAGP